MKKVCKLSFILICIGVMLVSSIAYAGITKLVSLSSDGVQGNNHSGGRTSISADGRFISFGSNASNLVSGDTNGTWDIFVHDCMTGITERVSVSSDGVQANGESNGRSSISADGRFVSFYSPATNLVPNDSNGRSDVFVHDRQTGKTELVSISSDGVQGNYDSYSPSINSDGRFITFFSYATNLVPGDTNGNPNGSSNGSDIFVHDRQTGITERVSISSDGVQANDRSESSFISADGRFVSFYSYASNLVSGDTNGFIDVFVHDSLTGITERVSVSSDGMQGNNNSFSSSISADGRFVSFGSNADNLVSGDTNGKQDVFIYDRQTGKTECVSISSNGEQGNDQSDGRSFMSFDGRFVTFFSYASNLVAGDTNGFVDIFVHDRQTGKTERISISSSGEQANKVSYFPSISDDGRFVVFDSSATNLVSGDSNNMVDIFVHEMDLYNIQGTVDLQNYSGEISDIPITVNFGNGEYSISLDLNSEGGFTIPDILNGTYDIGIKASHWLSKLTSGINVSVDTDLGTISLINGDVVDNNEVDFSDINAVRAAYGSFPGDGNWNAMADVDGSGEVDFTDINIVRSNYGEIGD